MACQSDTAWRAPTGVSLAELKEEPFIDFQSTWGTRLIVDPLSSDADRRIVFGVTALPMLVDLVARDVGECTALSRLYYLVSNNRS